MAGTTTVAPNLVSVRDRSVGYVRKFLGISRHGNHPFPPRPPYWFIFWSFVSCFAGMATVTALHYHANVDGPQNVVIGSFGALAVLIYGSIDSPFAQPRNVFFAHVSAALIGVICNIAIPVQWLAATLAVSISVTVMQLTRTVHPPAGATALLAVLGNRTSFMYILVPVLLGVTIMMTVALIVNNIKRQYPLYWVRPKRKPEMQSSSQGQPPAVAVIAPPPMQEVYLPDLEAITVTQTDGTGTDHERVMPSARNEQDNANSYAPLAAVIVDSGCEELPMESTASAQSTPPLNEACVATQTRE